MNTLRLLVSSLALAASALAATPPRPNVIIVLTDDLGYGDPRVYNRDSKIPTPGMDRLAAEGVRFTDAHTPSAVCTPTRYGLLTGRYCWRTRLKRGVLDGFSPPLIEPDRPTIASLLKTQGYRTACFGKWHLGMQWTRRNGEPETSDRVEPPATGFRSGENIDFSQPVRGGPRDVGFDYYFGISASLDMPPYAWIENDRCLVGASTIAPEHRELFLSAGRGVAAPDFKLDAVLPTLKARIVAWIGEQARTRAGQPFFLYLPLNSPHLPVVPSAAFAGKSGAGAYADFVMETDDCVSGIVEALRQAGTLDNTLLVFTSDNGGLWHAWDPVETDDVRSYKPTPRGQFNREHGHQSNGPLRGTKADIFEGGHRVPLIVSWPARIKPGAVSAVPVELTDLFATIAEATGSKLPAGAAPDSFSFLGALTGAGVPTTRPFLVHHSIRGVFAVREGDWKYAEERGSGGFSSPNAVKPAAGEATAQLYNLARDPQETRNVFADEPARVAHFEQLLAAVKRGSGLRP